MGIRGLYIRKANGEKQQVSSVNFVMEKLTTERKTGAKIPDRLWIYAQPRGGDMDEVIHHAIIIWSPRQYKYVRG